MKRYRLTKSGVCDCMLPDDNGPWVKYEDAEQAHREGWEQAKRQMIEEWELPWGLSGGKRFEYRMRAMEYGGKAND